MFIHRNGLQFLIPTIKRTGLLKLIKRIKGKKIVNSKSEKEVLDPTVRSELLKLYLNDTERLEVLLKKDLTDWKK